MVLKLDFIFFSRLLKPNKSSSLKLNQISKALVIRPSIVPAIPAPALLTIRKLQPGLAPLPVSLTEVNSGILPRRKLPSLVTFVN